MTVKGSVKLFLGGCGKWGELATLNFIESKERNILSVPESDVNGGLRTFSSDWDYKEPHLRQSGNYFCLMKS